MNDIHSSHELQAVKKKPNLDPCKEDCARNAASASYWEDISLVRRILQRAVGRQARWLPLSDSSDALRRDFANG
jgi:hypothetical protein